MSNVTNLAYPLSSLYPEIRRRIDTSVADASPTFRTQVKQRLTERPLPPVLLLPPAACAAVGGDPHQTLSISAACGMLLLTMRWFDDLEDRDRQGALWQEVGNSRALNLAAYALTRAWGILAEDSTVPRTILVAFSRATETLARGQDMDLSNNVDSFDRLWELMRTKTGAAFAFAAEAGAISGTRDTNRISILHNFGEQLGIMLQLLDDLLGIFRPVGQGDLALSKISLALLYGLTFDHPATSELRQIVKRGDLGIEQDRVRRILEDIDVRTFVAWVAIRQRQQSLDTLAKLGSAQTPFEEEGRKILLSLLDSGISDLEELIGQST